MVGGDDRGAVGGGTEGWDFFVSYTTVDQPWAEWIAWQLEAAGHRVLIQAWDFVAGTNWQIQMQEGMQGARRTIAVLSTAYLSSIYGESEWQAAHSGDPRGFERKLLPVRVENCSRPGLLRAIVSIDLFDQDPDHASRYLLEHVDQALSGRAKPTVPPDFPARRHSPPTSEPDFPTDKSESPALPAAPNRRQVHDDGLDHQGGRALDVDHAEIARSANSLTETRNQSAIPGQPIGWFDDPLVLEIHPAIDSGASTAGLPTLPSYVSRDHDKILRAIVNDAIGGHSRIIALVGGSSTGKTRACWEAIQLLPEPWRLWHPISPGHSEAVVDGLPQVKPHTVVWLNEAQHYLLTNLGEHAAAGLRELIRDRDRGPVLVLATLWPEYWNELTRYPAAGNVDLHVQARALLTLNSVTVPEAFTGPTLDALKEAAGHDPRLAEAGARAANSQVTQYLAGGPALLERYYNAPAPAKAVIEAAMDARRLGHGEALPEDLLAAAAPGYLADEQWDSMGEDWLSQAFAYTSEDCRGARGPLTRIRARPGQSYYDQPHYRLADYLYQHANADRRAVQPPGELWNTLMERAGPDDAARIADNAECRLLYCYAIPLYRRAVDADSAAKRGSPHTYFMSSRPGFGKRNAPYSLVGLLAQRGDLDELKVRADAGDSQAAARLAILLAERDDLDELRIRADADDKFASAQLAGLLIERGDLSELRARATASVGAAAYQAASYLVSFLFQRGDTDEALKILQPWVDTGEVSVEMRDLDELRADIDSGDHGAARLLAKRLTAEGHVNELSARAKTGDTYAEHGLVELLTQQHNLSAAIEIVRPKADLDGSTWANEKLADILFRLGDADELHARMNAGDFFAARKIADLLTLRGDMDGLDEVIDGVRARANEDDSNSASLLADLLAQRGRLDELRIRADAGHEGAAGRLADLLVQRGDLAELRARTDAGDVYAAYRLADLLVRLGRHEEAQRLQRFGFNPDGSIASDAAS